MPKRMIWKWREARIIRIFMTSVIFGAAVYMTLGFLKSYQIINLEIPNYYVLSSPMRLNGKLCKVEMARDIGTANAFVSFMTFIEYVLLCWALNA
jgi:hypothetical protein